MSDELRPLEPALEALLEEERRAVAPDLDAVRARVLARVAASLPPDGGGTDGSGGGTPDTGGGPAPSIPPTGSGARAGGALSTATVAGIAAVSLLLGGVGGWVLRGETGDPGEPPASVEQTTTAIDAPNDDPSPGPSALAPAPEPDDVSVTPAVPEPSPEPAPRRARRLPEPSAIADEPAPEPRTRERALIDRARSALQRGDGHEALLSLMQHERLYPRGVFAEERDRLVIEGLRSSGRRAQAERRRREFLVRYPDSPHAASLRTE